MFPCTANLTRKREERYGGKRKGFPSFKTIIESSHDGKKQKNKDGCLQIA